MATTSSSRPVVAAEGENMGPPGKAMARPRPDSSNRAVLGELTSNAKLDKTRTGSPLKRGSNAFDHDSKGFSYIKRRRLDNNHALTRRITPHSPQQQHQQQQRKGVSPNEPDEQSEGDSGRESQNSNATRGSFSSLINYDPSSQQQQAQSARPMSVKTAAEMLRLRLRIAFYKVRTNQINIPFSRLELHVKQRQQQQQPPPSPDALPMAPPPLRPSHERTTHTAEPPQPHAPPLLSTPNMYSNRFMPFAAAPSSSPPLVHDPLPRIAREAQARMAAAAAADRDSLDSEATELAEDHDDNVAAESPLDRNRRHVMLPTGT